MSVDIAINALSFITIILVVLTLATLMLGNPDKDGWLGAFVAFCIADIITGFALLLVIAYKLGMEAT